MYPVQLTDVSRREEAFAAQDKRCRRCNDGFDGRHRRKWPFAILGLALLITSAPAEVRVFVQSSNSVAWLKYECTAGEVVRAFALNVTVDQGRIVGITDFFRGPSTTASQGYGIFPAAFRDCLAVGPGTSPDWNLDVYTPLAVVADNPGDTLPGLNSSGVTLEFGGLWDNDEPSEYPPAAGTLCALRISQHATVSVTANASRGGVMATDPDLLLKPIFGSAEVQPPEITGLSLTNGLLSVSFAGGELETAPAITGPWTGTGEVSGQHAEPVTPDAKRFYRVRGF